MLRSVIAAAAALLAGSTLRAAPAPLPGAVTALTLAPCTLEHPLGLTRIEAQCGRLTVPEDPASPRGRQIGLYVARVPAVNRNAHPDPLFILAGGPGQAATDFYTLVAPAFARVQRDRDIILVDQRGTGRSHPLLCPDTDAGLQHPTPAQIEADTRACLRKLTRDASPAFYTTHYAVQDLERVRAALGLAQINLYGVSYGTRVAQQYLRRHPDRVRSVILDGVIPPPIAVGADTPLTAEAALAAILARCVADNACHRQFPDPQGDYRAVRARLAHRTVPVSAADPASGHLRRFAFGSMHLAAVLRLLSYTPESAALLPLLLNSAAHGDFAPLAGQFLVLDRDFGEQIATGMHNSVACTEDVPFYPPGPPSASLRASFLGTQQIDGLRQLCRSWPRGVLDSDLHTALHSDVPALLLSGSDDPVTPPAWTAQAARGFTRRMEVVLPGFGHGLIAAPCMDSVIAQFVAQGLQGLDTRCTAAARPLPFFLTANGPAP
ncbi:MAG: alpha/beta fold hydrolase [Proteobacteria bacterium]|nr:alpha/beta fold hydrolase [Pseudomonadota bacterium]